MTIEEAREYWSRRLERAAGYSDEHWDAEERHAHKEYIDALKHAVTALAICREREEAEKPKTNGDRIRQMTDDEELLSAIGMSCYRCVYNNSSKCSCECNNGCYAGNLEWLRKEVSEDATERTD